MDWSVYKMDLDTVTLNGKKFKVEKRKFKFLRKIGKHVVGTLKGFIGLEKMADADLTLFVDSVLDKPFEILVELYPELTEEDVEESFADELINAFMIGIAAQGLEQLKNATAPLQKTMTLLK